LLNDGGRLDRLPRWPLTFPEDAWQRVRRAGNALYRPRIVPRSTTGRAPSCPAEDVLTIVWSPEHRFPRFYVSAEAVFSEKLLESLSDRGRMPFRENVSAHR